VDFGLKTLGGTQLLLTVLPMSLFDLVSGPLTPNQKATADYINALIAADVSPELQALLDDIRGLPDETAILAALDELAPEHYLSQVQTSWFASLGFVRGAMSCPEPGTAKGYLREGQCYWARLSGGRLDWDRTNDNIGGEEDAWGLTGGLQARLENGWLAGGAVSYQQSDIETGNRASSEGNRLQATLTAKRDIGATRISAAAFAGFGSFDTDRPVSVPSPGVVAHGEQDIVTSGAHLRVSHTFAYADWYLRPLVDLNATYLSFGDLTETDGGAANLDVEGESEWFLSAAPALEFGGGIVLENGAFIRPFLRAGMTWMSEDTISMTSRFAATPESIAPFIVTSEFDHVFADLSAGVEMAGVDGSSLKLNYDGKFGEDFAEHSGALKLGLRF